VQLLQAKGLSYSLKQLFNGHTQAAGAFANGRFLTVYLAPYNYHRIHMPADAELIETIYVPGKLYSVNDATTRLVPGLYTGNERLISIFQGEQGQFSVVMVGALNVGSIATSWSGEVQPYVRAGGEHHCYTMTDPGPTLKKGEWLGQFNMGSTIILIADAGYSDWGSEIASGNRISMGQRLTQPLSSSNESA
jgi:phosphatidylserine decarboxylase